MDYRNKLQKLSELLRVQGDMESIHYIEEFILSCGEYIYKVNKMETVITVPNQYMDFKEYQEYKQKLDFERHITHNSLISSLKTILKLCNSVNFDPIYCGDIENRVEVGNFAFEVVAELFRTRQL